MEIIKFSDDIKINNFVDVLYNSYRESTYDQYNKLQCYAHKRRSIDDLVCIMNYYGMPIDYESLYKIIKLSTGLFRFCSRGYSADYDTPAAIHRFFRCGDIKKWVLSVDSIYKWRKNLIEPEITRVLSELNLDDRAQPIVIGQLSKREESLRKLKNGIRFKEDVIVNSLADVIFYTFQQESFYAQDMSLQCKACANRSPGDINRLCNFYGYKTTVAKIKKIMDLLGYGNYFYQSGNKFNYDYCPWVRKMVYQVQNWTKLHDYITDKLKDYEI